MSVENSVTFDVCDQLVDVINKAVDKGNLTCGDLYEIACNFVIGLCEYIGDSQKVEFNEVLNRIYVVAESMLNE